MKFKETISRISGLFLAALLLVAAVPADAYAAELSAAGRFGGNGVIRNVYSETGSVDFTLPEARSYVEKGDTVPLPEVTILSGQDPETVPVTWTSSNPALLSIDAENGTMTGLGKGDVTVSAEIYSVVKSCDVSITMLPRSLEFPVDEITVQRGVPTHYPVPARVPMQTYTGEGWTSAIDYVSADPDIVYAGSPHLIWEVWEMDSDTDLKPKLTGLQEGTTEVTLTAQGVNNTVVSDSLTVHVVDTVYTINFDGSGMWVYDMATGTLVKDVTGEMETIQVPYGETVNLPACGFQKTGYHLKEWNTAMNGSGVSYADGQEVSFEKSEETPVMTLYAIWEPNVYTIHYELNGGIFFNPENVRTTYTYSDVKNGGIALSTPYKDGRSFRYWYTDPEFTELAPSPYEIPMRSTGDKWFYARWYTPGLTIHFDGNGATSGEMEDRQYLFNGSGNSVTGNLPFNSFKKAGSTFVNWNTELDGSGTSYLNYQSLSTINNAALEDRDFDFTLYAQWNTKQYTITYQNGSNPDNPTTYNYETPDITFLPANDKTGYDFAGWYSDNYYSTPVTGIPTHSEGNKTIYAKFVPHHYTVHFDLNGGTSDPLPDTSATYGVPFNLPDGSAVYRSYSDREYYGFTGWNTAADGSGTAFDTYTSTAINLTAEDGGEVTLYAQWTPMFYLIHYDPNGGTGTMPDQVCSANGQYDSIRACQFTRAGASFAGWYTQPDGTGMHYIAGEQVRGLGAAGETVTLYANWSYNRYNIYYYNVSDAGVDNSENPVSFTYADVENGPLMLAAPTWEGHTFIGWYKDAELTEPADSIPQGTQSAQYFYAKWELNSWKIRFNGNGSALTPANGSMSMLTCYYGEDIQLPANKFTRNGCKMTGWNTKADGSGTAYEKNALITGFTAEKDAVIDLYAQWQFYQYSIKYWRLGLTGSIGGNPKTYNSETPDIVLKPASRNGYDFLGWYYDGAYTDEVTVIPQGSTGKQILFAKWKSHRYTVVFDGSGATSGTMKTMTCKYGVDYNLRKNSFKRTGYTFTGWNTKASGKGSAYTDEQEFRNLKSAEGASVTFYAQWTPTKYNITYELAGGTNSKANLTRYTYFTETFTLRAATRKGYTFLGWYKDAALTKKVTAITQGSIGDKTFYAKWTPVTYTITYKLNGGTNSANNPLEYTIESAAITLAKPTRTGYTFAGWYKDSEYTAKVTGINAGSTGNRTLYAKWRANTYTIVFDGNGNDSNYPMNETVSCTYGKAVKLPKNTAYKSGYYFIGWSLKQNGSGTVYADEASVKNLSAKNNAVVTLYAVWGVKTPSFSLGHWPEYIRVVIRPNYGAAGYEIHRSTSKSGTYTKIASLADTGYILYYSDKNVTAGKTYYYKVREYVTDASGKKVYSDFAPVQSMKTAEPIKVVTHIWVNSDEWSNNLILYVQNKGNKDLYLGVSNDSMYPVHVMPNDTGNYSNANFIVNGKVTKKVLVPADGETYSLVVKLTGQDRYFQPGQAYAMVYFTYDDAPGYFTSEEDGGGMYVYTENGF